MSSLQIYSMNDFCVLTSRVIDCYVEVSIGMSRFERLAYESPFGSAKIWLRQPWWTNSMIWELTFQDGDILVTDAGRQRTLIWQLERAWSTQKDEDAICVKMLIRKKDGNDAVKSEMEEAMITSRQLRALTGRKVVLQAVCRILVVRCLRQGVWEFGYEGVRLSFNILFDFPDLQMYFFAVGSKIKRNRFNF